MHKSFKKSGYFSEHVARLTAKQDQPTSTLPRHIDYIVSQMGDFDKSPHGNLRSRQVRDKSNSMKT